MKETSLSWLKGQAKSSGINRCWQSGKGCRQKVINSASEVITLFLSVLYALGVITDYMEALL